jgi:hypothetical protein
VVNSKRQGVGPFSELCYRLTTDATNAVVHLQHDERIDVLDERGTLARLPQRRIAATCGAAPLKVRVVALPSALA